MNLRETFKAAMAQARVNLFAHSLTTIHDDLNKVIAGHHEECRKQIAISAKANDAGEAALKEAERNTLFSDNLRKLQGY